MKNLIILTAFAICFMAESCLAQMGPGMMGGSKQDIEQQYQWTQGWGMGPGMMGWGMGPGMMYGTQPEMQKFFDDTVDLRRKIHMKQFEYFEAMRDPKTSREKIMNLQKEIQDLTFELQGKAPEGFFYGR